MDSDDDFSDEELDSRVQGELENLNNATTGINSLENSLEREGAKFRSMMSDSSQKLRTLAKKLGRCVNKTRPYFESVKVADKALGETQEAAVRYQRAMGLYSAAKETVQLAEKKQTPQPGEDQREFDSAWQEMLNHATMRFMEAEVEKAQSEKIHSEKASLCSAAQNKVHMMEKQMQRSIARARPYFEMKEQLESDMKDQKEKIEGITRSIMNTKRNYSDTLKRLEGISEEVHQQRKKRLQLPPRTPGVGAEYDPPVLPEINLEGESDFDNQSTDLDSLTASVDGVSLQDSDSGFGTGAALTSSESGSNGSKNNVKSTQATASGNSVGTGHQEETPDNSQLSENAAKARPTSLGLQDTSKAFQAVARKHDAQENCELTPEQLLEIQITGDFDIEDEIRDVGSLSPTEIVERKDIKQYYTLGSMENLDEFDVEGTRLNLNDVKGIRNLKDEENAQYVEESKLKDIESIKVEKVDENIDGEIKNEDMEVENVEQRDVEQNSMVKVSEMPANEQDLIVKEVVKDMVEKVAAQTIEQSSNAELTA